MNQPNQSFLPEDYVEQRVARRTILICVSLFTIVLVAVVVTWFVTGSQSQQVRDQLTAINQDLETKALQIKQIEQLQSQKQSMMTKARVTAQLVEAVPRPILLSELINEMPPSLTFQTIELETKLVKPAPARTSLAKAKRDASAKAAEANNEITVPDKDATVTLVGLAPAHKDIADYQKALTANPLFTAVNLGGIEAMKLDGRDMLEFRLQLELNQDLDLQHHEPLRLARRPDRNPLGDQSFDAQGAAVIPVTTPPATN
ncbi:MAG: PilN domain-containing protein [Planctomycetota bacterium]